MESDEPMDAAPVIVIDLAIHSDGKKVAYVRDNRLWVVMPEADLEVTGGPVMPAARPALMQFVSELGRATGLVRFGDLMRKALDSIDATPSE